MLIEIDFLILDTTPQSLDKDIVKASSDTSHANFDAPIYQLVCKRTSGKLSPLITIEDSGLSKSQTLFLRKKSAFLFVNAKRSSFYSLKRYFFRQIQSASEFSLDLSRSIRISLSLANVK